MNLSETYEITVETDQPVERIDHYLSKKISLSRNQVQKLLEHQKILLNQKPIQSSHKVHPGDHIRVTRDREPPSTINVSPEEIPLTLLYEDEHLAVIDKPAELVVHASPGHFQHTLVNALLFHLNKLSSLGGGSRPGIVHRLDKGTSGVMVIAKSNEAHAKLAQQFHDRLIEKTYWALCYGNMKSPEGKFESRLGRSRGDRKKISSKTRKGREAKTHYRVLDTYHSATLLELKPQTGRTHQLRVHLSEAGHPMLGDPLYGGKQWIKKLSGPAQKKVQELGHQTLHSWKIIFYHPQTQKRMSFEAEVPLELRDIELLLKKNSA